MQNVFEVKFGLRVTTSLTRYIKANDFPEASRKAQKMIKTDSKLRSDTWYVDSITDMGPLYG